MHLTNMPDSQALNVVKKIHIDRLRYLKNAYRTTVEVDEFSILVRGVKRNDVRRF